MLEISNILIIVNTDSGKKNSLKIWNNLKLTKNINSLYNCELILTSSYEEMYSYFMKNKEEINNKHYKFIMFISGDGTIYRYINMDLSLSSLENVPIFHYPAGSGNGFYRSITNEMSLKNIDDYVDCIIRDNHNIKKMDLMNILMSSGDNPRDSVKAFLSVTWGMIADVDIETEDYRWMGYFRFVYGVIMSIIKKRGYYGTLKYKAEDGEDKVIEGNFILFLANNLSHITHNSNASPHSKSDDGYIFISYILAPVSRCELLKIMLNFDNGTYINHSKVKYVKTKGFSLEKSDGKIVIDGELIDNSINKIDVEIESKSLRFVSN